jgi:RNA polymerase sigma-70 factor (ECF subfamily)
MAEETDPDLAALRSGDEAAFGDLLRRHHGWMLRLAASYVRDPGAAEDVVQEAWLTVIKSLDRFEGRSAFKTWIFGIVMNLARARRRKESRQLPFTSFFDRRGHTVDPARFGADGKWRAHPRTWENVPESKMLAAETLDRVRRAIDTLPERHRQVIVLRDVVDLDAAEVSRILGISPENERVRLHRARAAVRKALEDYLA